MKPANSKLHAGPRRFRPAALIMLALALVMLAAAGDPNDFLAQRRKFRDEIKNKKEQKLDAKGNYLSVIFTGEEGKYNFGVTPEDRARLTKHMKTYFGAGDDTLLPKMVDELNSGHYIIFKEYKNDSVFLKVIFLTPKAKYWDWLVDGNAIEKMFHTYNFSVGLGSQEPNKEMVVLQTEGSFLGITQAVSLPIRFEKDQAAHQYKWKMPTQAEIVAWVEKMPPVVAGRTKPEEKFIDACRTHPFFQQKKGDAYTVTDEDILKLYKTTVSNKDKDCPVKTNEGAWTIHEDYPYLVVDYDFSTKVNISALIPDSLKFISGSVEDIAQTITDEVSVKYLPLSMKNFRDSTQEWTKTGGPKP
jgi:hypothetical protein